MKDAYVDVGILPPISIGVLKLRHPGKAQQPKTLGGANKAKVLYPEDVGRFMLRVRSYKGYERFDCLKQL